MNMERFCSNCRAVLAKGLRADWCPACGGAIIERETMPTEDDPTLATPQGPSAAPQGSLATPQGLDHQVLDHRGIVLPRRFPLGGIITPQ